MKFLRKIYGFLKSLNGDYMEKDEIVRMEKRLQMLIALVFFTPAVSASFGSDTLQESKTIFAWCAIVAVYIIIYLVIDSSKGKINKFRGNILTYGIWFNLIAFVPYFLFLAIYGNDIISGFPLVTLFITIITMFWSPLLILLMLAFEFMLGEFFSFVKLVKSDGK